MNLKTVTTTTLVDERRELAKEMNRLKAKQQEIQQEINKLFQDFLAITDEIHARLRKDANR